jgi:hypothetical protein
LARLSKTQLEVLARAFANTDLPEPHWSTVNDEGTALFWWEVGNFTIRAGLAQDGTFRSDVTTEGRIEEFPLIGALVAFNTKLAAAFVYTVDGDASSSRSLLESDPGQAEGDR